ncbi:MAG TPA: hypothetical protein VE131_12100 [Terriglobales bacterium]|nr:hypothetical protein [Terriglobales bacterium]
MNAALVTALVPLVPVGMLLSGAAILFSRTKAASAFFQLFGAGCLVVVVLTHVFEALILFSWMHWGLSTALVMISI